MSFPRYPKYKDSGVEWLGEVPEHWNVCALSYRYEVALGKMLDEKRITGEHLAPYLRNTDVQWGRINIEDLPQMDFEGDDLERYSLRKGDLLVCEGGDVGRAAIWEGPLNECYYQKALHRVRPASANRDCPRFLCSVFRVANSLGVFSSSGGKSTIAHLTAEDLRRYRLSFPPVAEQELIADFLDREIGKVGELVAEQRRLMELLKEKRQAVISHAVTKGLNPRAPMKPSNIEWLGDVPEHWPILLLKRAFRSVDYGISDALDSEGSVAILRMGNIENGRVVMDDLKYTDKVEPGLLLRRGDLLYNRTNSLDLIGKVGMFVGAAYPVSFASYLVRMRTVEDCVPEFFAYLLNTEGVLGLARSSAFVAIGQCNLNPTRYGQIEIAIPPKAEQLAIAGFLDAELMRLDALAAEAQKAIDLLQERRTALISAAVTGQIDVRKLAAA